MDLPREEENFSKSTKMITEIMPKHLRQLFVTEWNTKFPSQPWANDAVSGQLLFNAIPPSAKNRNGDLNRKELQPKILSGDANSWDPTVLFYLFFYADLQLIDTFRPYTQRAAAINRFRELRNSYFGHPANMSMSVDDFEALSKEVKDIAKDVFGAVAENEIDQIIHSQIKSPEYHALKKKYDEEKRDYDVVMSRLDALEPITLGAIELKDDVKGASGNVSGIEGDIQRLESSISELVSNLEESRRKRSLEPITQEVIDAIKEIYRQCHMRHRIQTVDDNNKIELREVDISDFAVELKICQSSWPKSDFRDEAKRYLENLKDATGDAIDMSNLIGDTHRVTFVRGIAGMGKSVLAKQLTYGWANGDIYQDFYMCVMFECRDLNYFKGHEGAKLKKHEILDEFIKSKVDYDLGDGEGILFVVDGLDELYDLYEEDSIIGQLLSCKIYPMSKIILTGRPHIELKLHGYHNVGGLKTFEIQGFTNDQINIYIEKFSKREDYIVNIYKTKGASNVPLIHVPQFLNAVCCIAILSKGRGISNSAELYSWTLYLLMKQHADKHGSSRKMASEIFKEFSQILSTLSEVCHNLLATNKIIFEGDIKFLLGDTGKDKEFDESLFVDMSDNIIEKYQFRHLSLMEFLSALYICKKDRKHLMESIKDNLEKGLVEGISFVCRLFSGFSYEGVIKEMLKNVVGKKAVDEKQFLVDVVELVDECGLDQWTKLNRSFEVITQFLHMKFNDKNVLMSILRRCRDENFLSDVNTSENVVKICSHLKSCAWKEDDIRFAFANVQFSKFDASNLDQLHFASNYLRINEGVLGNLGGISLLWMKTTLTAVRRQFLAEKENKYCGWVTIEQCELNDEVCESSCNDRQLTGLSISRCHLKTVNSFINACSWGISSKCFELLELDINVEWWERMVEMIQDWQQEGDLKLERLNICKCTTRMNHNMASRILKCGVRLSINGKDFFPESSLEHQFERVLTVSTHASSESVTTDIYKDDTRKERFVFDSSGGSLESHTLSLSLDVPENSVDSEIYLDISSVEMSTIPPITFEFGETAVGDVINMIPSGIQFKKPATLTVRHSVVDLPELSSIVVKYYDHEKENWIALPCDTDDENQDAMAISAEISVTTFYVLCMSLDSVTYTIPKAGISFSPFDSKYGVKLIFEEGTFGDESALVQLKMNAFSEEARTELKRFGLKPFPILHVSETSMRQPVKPVTLKLRMNGRIQTDEKLFILYGGDNDFRDETGSIQYKIGKNFISIQLTHFSKVGGIIANFGQWTFEQAQKLLKIFSGPRYLVKFGLFCKAMNDVSYLCHVACRRADRPQECGELIENGYSRLESFQARLHSRTELRVEVTGDYKAETSTTKFTFIQGSCTYTAPFRILQSTEEASSNNCNLLVYKNDDQRPFETVPFSVTKQGPPRQIPRDEQIGDQSSIETILNKRDLLLRIAVLLEQGCRTHLKELALLFGIREPSQLTTTEPSRNFFTNLANNRRDITLADIKKLIEQDLRKTRQSIIPPVEKAIAERTVDFTLRSTLAELNPQDWLYFLKNVADKLLENTFQLPSWKDVAGYYSFDFNTIESFCANIREERPTVKLFQHLVFVENVPTISTLKGHLQTLNRYDIIRLIDQML